MLRFGLCCIFRRVPITFRTTTFALLQKKEKPYEVLSDVIVHNCVALKEALLYCSQHHIGAFRVTSRFFPLYTHPKVSYQLETLKEGARILTLLQECKRLATHLNMRLTLHPDQFVLLNSPRPEVLRNSLAELE